MRLSTSLKPLLALRYEMGVVRMGRVARIVNVAKIRIAVQISKQQLHDLVVGMRAIAVKMEKRNQKVRIVVVQILSVAKIQIAAKMMTVALKTMKRVARIILVVLHKKRKLLVAQRFILLVARTLTHLVVPR
jgi:hypothetical protein